MLKSRRRVSIKTATTAATTTIADRRRDFFSGVLGRIKDLPDDSQLPGDVMDDMKKYSRSQTSEKPIIRLTDYPVGPVRTILSSLLQDLDGNLSSLINDMLTKIKLSDETLRYMGHDEKLKHKLAEYFQTHPLGPDLGKDLVAMDEVFAPLFQTPYIQSDTIYTFLTTNNFIHTNGRVSIHHAISSFLHEHRFDPIRKLLLEEGFEPKSNDDWKILPQEYYDQFPRAFWKLRTWDQFIPFVELSKRYSLDMGEFVKYSFYQKEKHIERATTIRPSPHPKFIAFYNHKEAELLQRTRPWVRNLVSVLIIPKKGCERYTGRPYGKYNFPTDIFYKDLANYSYNQEKNSLVLTIHNAELNIHAEMKVYHLLQDGQILPQTYTVFEEGMRYMSTERPLLQFPKITEHFLNLPLADMSENDQNTVCQQIQHDLTFFLSMIMDEKLDFDAMASYMVSSLLDRNKDKPLREFLQHAFQYYFLFSPRYSLDLMSTIINQRMNLFFYRLDRLDELPVSFYYPQHPFLGEEKQQCFDRWHKRCQDNFVQETLYCLFMRNYPALRVKLQDNAFTSTPPKSILLGLEEGNKLSLLHPYRNQYIYLPDVASSILQNQEYLVDGKPVPGAVMDQIGSLFDLERVRAGLGSYMMDNDFELQAPSFIPTTMTTNPTPIQPIATLPDFKQKAYAFLASMA